MAMSTTLNTFGARPMNRTWAPQLIISNSEAPADQYILDPTLPVLGQDPLIPNSDYIVISRGRLLSVKNSSAIANTPYANTSANILTLANGADGSGTDLKPMGFAEQQYFKQYDGQIQTFPQITKGKLVSLPYIQASNGVYGNMSPGDYVTASYGSAINSYVNPSEVGKVVKWVPRKTYSQTFTSSGSVILTAAVYPAFKPQIISADASGTQNVGSVTLVYNNTAISANAGAWVATFTGAVTHVLYSYGQDADNIAGQCASFFAVGTAGGALSQPNHFPGWLEWVRDNFGVWAFPPLAVPRPYTTITSEAHTSGESGSIGNTFRLAQFPVVPMNSITIYMTGTRVDPLTGLVSTLTNALLPLASTTYFEDFTYGQDYDINPVMGIINFDSNISVTSFTVSYSVETSFLDGKIYNPGQIGLTSGQFSGVPGTPTHLELFGVVADMHVMLR